MLASTPPHLIDKSIDVHVGERIRLRRKALRMSQITLAQGLGLTFQQVQKYERASNRVSASKLWDCAQLLGVPVAFFFEGLPSGGDVVLPGEAAAGAFMLSAEGVALAADFPRLAPEVRRQVLALVRALAAEAVVNG